MKFEPRTLDFKLSPYSGLTRESWLEAGRYLLEGIFQHVDGLHSPVVVPRKETRITYPHHWSSPEEQAAQRTAEVFEGLTRSFFIAAPLIANIPDLKICGLPMADYYKSHVLRVCTRGDELYVGTYEDLQETTGHADPYRAFQQTVETCALVICLWVSRDKIWDTYTREERDIIAGFLTSYAHAGTIPHNWRLFNMLDMAFLHMEGYPVRKEIMRDHAQAILNFYAGDGWYRDGHSFDYYSCWAFQMYAPIWNLWYGYENEPYLAEKFQEHSNRLMETYGDFFDRDGWTNMWGRSGIYRNAATSAFEGNLLLRETCADPGHARRICSGSLLQFLGREDFLYQGIPTLGFYGQFLPLVQSYSCAESPLWLGKAFLCLHLPGDHPFWTATENNGTWETLGKKEVKVTCLDGPALCFSNHQANGETILRTGKVVKEPGAEHDIWNYAKLNYNTKYPWESSPNVYSRSQENAVGMLFSGCTAQQADASSASRSNPLADSSLSSPAAPPVEAQQYVMQDDAAADRRISKPNVTLWHGQREGVLYRRQLFDCRLEREHHWVQAVDLADFTVPWGILRVDRLKLFRGPVTLTLGSYGFPHNGTEIIEKTCQNARAVILKGRDSRGQEKQMAMTVYEGWETLALLYSQGTNPDSERSIVAYASMSRREVYGGCEPYVLISQVITKESHEDFLEEELFPIAEILSPDLKGCGCFGPVTLRLKDGSTRSIDFEGVEGKLML